VILERVGPRVHNRRKINQSVSVSCDRFLRRSCIQSENLHFSSIFPSNQLALLRNHASMFHTMLLTARITACTVLSRSLSGSHRLATVHARYS